MDWIFILQTVIFGLYITLIYNVNKSGFGRLKEGEIYISKFWSNLYTAALFLMLSSGIVGGIVVLSTVSAVFDSVYDLNFFEVSRDWKMFIFLMFLVSFINLIVFKIDERKRKIEKKHIETVKGRAFAMSDTIMRKAIDRNLQGYISIADLKSIIEAEQKENEQRYIGSPFEKID